jgi:hypothetical protein
MPLPKELLTVGVNLGELASIEPEVPGVPSRRIASFFFFSVLGFGLRAYTLGHSTSPFL